MHLKVEVFPAPFNPSKPKHSPVSTQKFKFFIAIIFSCFLQQPPLLNSFLIFFNLTTYSLFILLILLLISFSFYIFIYSLFALSISSKTKLSVISVDIFSSFGFL